MARISLDRVITGGFITRFGSASSSSSSQSVANALTGRGNVSITDSLRLGARTLTSAVQALNSTISVVNVARSTLDKLESIVDKAIILADRASQITTASQTRQTLNTQFKELGSEFRKFLEKAKLNDSEYLTKDGLSDIFKAIGLDSEKSDSIAAIFDQFVLSEEDTTLASDAIQGKRPIKVPVKHFRSHASDQTYQLNQLSDNNITTGAISTENAVISDHDTILNQNPAYEALLVRNSDGSYSSFPAGDLTSNITFKASNETTGYSVISSSQNFLGFNASNRTQLFLVDDTGTIVHQLTNNTLASTTFNSVDLASNGAVDDPGDGVTVAYTEERLIGTQLIRKATITGSVGGDPATENTVTTLESVALLDYQASNVKISDDGNYVAYYLTDNGAGTTSIRMRNSAGTADSNFDLMTYSSDFGFIDNDVLAFTVDSGGGNKRVVYERYGKAGYTEITGDIDSALNFDALQRNGVAGNYINKEKISDVAAQDGFTTDIGRVFIRDDGGTNTVFFTDANGTSTGSLASASYAMKLVGTNASTGQALVATQEDFLGYNGSNYWQVYLVDTDGNPIRQLTNNGSTVNTIYSAEISDDGSTLAYTDFIFPANRTELKRVTIAGDDPTLNTYSTIVQGAGGNRYSSLSLSSDGAYVGVVDETTSGAKVYNPANTIDSFLNGRDDIDKIGFSASGELIVARTDGGTDDLYKYTYGDANFSSAILSDQNIGAFDVRDGYFSFYDSSTTKVKTYDSAATAIGSTAALSPTSISRVSIGFDTNGYVELGVYGLIPSSDVDSELYAFRSISGHFALDYDAGGGERTIEMYNIASATVSTTLTASASESINSLNLAYDQNGNAALGIVGDLSDHSNDADRELYSLTANTQATTGKKFSTLTDNFSTIFAEDSNIDTRGNAYRILTDLKALKSQIDDNKSALSSAVDALGQNLQLVRETGLALLDIANGLRGSEDANTVAQLVRNRVSQNARAALAQAENLDPIVVAALTLSS